MAKKNLEIFKDLNLTLDKTNTIPADERDQNIIRDNWDALIQGRSREVRIFDNKEKIRGWESDPKGQENQRNPNPRGKLVEHILLWPSAPIYALGWPRNYPPTEYHRMPWHTMRILKRPDATTIDRIYIFFNGLNEWHTLQTYYRLADLLEGQK